jgi:uncharacterized protein (TIGR03437 family)
MRYLTKLHLGVAIQAALCFAYAQAITPVQSSLNLTADPGNVSQTATLTVNSSGAPLLLNISVSTFGTGSWLYASPGIVGTPATVIVYGNASQLGSGVYLGEILVSAVGATNSPVSIPVTFTVGTAGVTTLSVTPQSLTFNGQAGGLSPATQTLAIASTPTGVGFAISASTENGLNWLVVSTPIATAPAAVTVSILTGGLAPGVYRGTITLTPATGGSVNVPVTLNLTSGIGISASSTGFQFYYQIGSFLPPYQTFDLSGSGGAPVSFAITPSTSDAKTWLSASPLFGATPQTIAVSVSPSGFGPGVYTGNLHVSAPSASNPTLDLPVKLTVATGPLLTISALPAKFVYQIGGTTPPQQTIALGSSTAALNYSVIVNASSGGSWLAVSPASGITPASLTITVNPVGLPAGDYDGSISITAPDAANSPVIVPVKLSVSDTTAITATLASVELNYQIGGLNQILSQVVGVGSTGGAVDVTATAVAATCGGNWLQVFPASFTAPGTVTIAASPLGFTTPTDCTGTVVLTQKNNGQGVQIPVTLRVSTTPLLNISPLALAFSAPFEGDTTGAQTINLTTTDNSSAAFTATPSADTASSWLKVQTSSPTTPATITARADPANLSVGTYHGSISVTSPVLSTARVIPVTFKVTSTIAAAVSPAAVSFLQVAGGTTPAPRDVTLTSPGASISFVATPSTANAVNWLSATPNTGVTPSVIRISVNPGGLAPGQYNGSVIVTLPAASNSPLAIPVTLSITQAQTISASTPALTFSYGAGNPVPPEQQVSVTSVGGGPLSITAVAGTSTGGGWLKVAPTSGTTPATFSVSVDPAGLGTGSYDGTVTFTAAGAGGNPLTVAVRLNVTGVPVPAIGQVTNAASGMRGAISPGEIVTLKGESLGPADGVSFELTPAGTVDTVLAGSRVFFDEFAAPMLYTSPGQINAIVPYEIAGRATVQVSVEYRGVRSPVVTVQVAASAPGLFTVTQTGSGQGAILNQDNSLNGTSAPAAKGSVIQIFATGEGVTRPPLQTGSVTSGVHQPIGPVVVLIGNFSAEILFAGSAPDAVAGLFQVNARVPAGVMSGPVPIAIVVGGVSSQPGVTLRVE